MLGEEGGTGKVALGVNGVLLAWDDGTSRAGST